MAKTRLNTSKREALMTFARRKVGESLPATSVEKAKQHYLEVFEKYHRRYLQESSLDILRKYDCTYFTSSARVTWIDSCGDHRVTYLDFPPRREGEKSGWELPRSNSCIPITQEVIDAQAAVEKADTELDSARNNKLRNYKSLVYNSRNVEDVLEVWEEVQEILPDLIQSTALVTLSAETIKSIKEDVNVRKESRTKARVKRSATSN